MRSLNFFAFISIGIVVAFALCVPEVSSAQYSISTIAGGGPNGLAALKTSIGYPESIAFDAAGNAYIAESYDSSQILEVSTAGAVTVVAGNGTPGYSGDGGPPTSAALDRPEGVFVDSSENIFIADTENSVIREVVASTGNIKTVVGVSYDASSGSACQSDGDGGPALSAHLCLPYSVYVDGSGNIFIADFGNSTIREVLASTGNIQTVAGTPGTPGYIDNVLATKAELDLPASVFGDASGNIIIADTFNSVIRVVNPGAQAVTIGGTPIPAGYILTVAGSQYDSMEGARCQFTGDNGPALSAFLCQPTGVFVDASDNIYVADYANFAIRKIAAGTISTVAGTLGTDCQTYATTGCGNGASATAATALLNYPSGVALNSGNIFIADTEDFVVREVTGGNIEPFAGYATLAYSGDGGLATNAELNDPGAVFVDGSGNVFIADTGNSVIREVLASSGDIQTVAGSGVAGATGVGVAPTTAELNLPGGVFVDASGNIFIADTTNSAIREVVASTGLIQTVVGTLGTAGYSGDGGAPTNALLSNPNAVVVDGSGNIYIADTANSAIRVVNTGTAQITVGGTIILPNTIQTVAGKPTTPCDAENTVASCGDGGPATSAYLNFPDGIALDVAGDIFIADTFDNAVRKVSASTATTPGIIQTVAGTIGAAGGFSGDGAVATSALLDSPSGVFIDASNDIFIADFDNAAIREVVAATGFIQTVAGIPATTGGFPTPGFSGDGGPATNAELDAPSGVFGTSAGKLFIADTNNSRVRELAPAALTVTVAPSTATVVVGALQQYTATVTGNANTAVTWFVNGAAGGNATVGTISTSGLFTAPATVPGTATVTIAAISQVDNTTSGSAQATIVSASTTNSVAVTPTPIQVYTGATQAFVATDNSAATTAVTWYVEGTQGGNATVGTIDGSGNYTAPTAVPSPAIVVVEALLQADLTAIGTASVTIVPAPSAAPPAPQTVSPGGTANYSLSLKANSGIPNQAITLSCLSSSLPPGATCTFSPTTITPSSSPVAFTLAVAVPSTSASSLPQLDRRHQGLGPQMCMAFLPLAALFLLGKKSRDQRWLWLVLLCIFLTALVACGGGSSSSTPPANTYSIQVQGTTSTQPKPVTITTATLIVQ